MSEPKTRHTKASVAVFLNSIEDSDKRRDAKALHKLTPQVSDEMLEDLDVLRRLVAASVAARRA